MSKAVETPIFHERALWSLEDIAAYSRFSTSQLRERVVCLPEFPAPTRVTPSSHPRWVAGDVWTFFESKKGSK